MDGVIILTSEEVTTAWKYNYSFVWIGAIICFIFGIIIALCARMGFAEWALTSVLLSFAGAIIGSCFVTFFAKPIETETHYQVTINDEVSMKEFYEKYEVLEQKDDLFTIREKAED